MTNKCQFCNNEAYGAIGYLDKFEYDDYYIKQGDNVVEFGYGSIYDFCVFIIDKKFFEMNNLDIYKTINICDSCFTEKAKPHSKLVDSIANLTTDFYEWLFDINDNIESKFEISGGKNPTDCNFEISIDNFNNIKAYYSEPLIMPDDDVIFIYLWTYNSLDPIFLMLSKTDMNLPSNLNYATINHKLKDISDEYLDVYKYKYALWINKQGKIEYTPPELRDRIIIPNTNCLYKSDEYILQKDDSGYYLEQYKSDTETYERVEIDNIDNVITTFSINGW